MQPARPFNLSTGLTVLILLLMGWNAPPILALDLLIGPSPGDLEQTPNIDNLATLKRYHLKDIETAQALSVSCYVYSSVTCNGDPINTICEARPTSLRINFQLLDESTNTVLRTTSQVYTVSWYTYVYDDLFELSRAYISSTAFSIAGLNLNTGPYRVVGVVDPLNAITETNEANNTSTSADSFNYRIYSGVLNYGPVVTSLTSLSLSGLCIVGSVPVIAPTAARWTHEWGTSNFFVSPSCYNISLNADGYSYDLTTPAGATPVGLGTLSGPTPSGITAKLDNVTLDSTGAHFVGAGVTLPRSVSVHDLKVAGDPKQGFRPCGEDDLYFSGASGDFTHIYDIPEFKQTKTREYHGYGLPFNLIAKQARFTLADHVGILLDDVVAMHVHFPSYVNLHGGDPRGPGRERKGFPSNDVLFMGYDNSAPTEAVIGKNGIDSDGLRFDKADSYLKTPRTSFPQGRIIWVDSFKASVSENTLKPMALPVDSFLMSARRICPDDSCGDYQSPKSYFVKSDDGKAWITEDGSVGTAFQTLGGKSQWGKWESGEPTFDRDDGDKGGVFYMPGYYMPKTKDETVRTVSQVLLGSRLFDDGGEPGTLAPLSEGGGTTDAGLGNGFYAGLTLGPEFLESLDTGHGSKLEDDQLIRFNGNSSYDDFKITEYTKYFLRPSGVTGVFNTSFEGILNIYGYDIDFRRFAFRQVYNQLDGKTFLDGTLDIPYPCDIKVSFLDLDLLCSGDLGAGTVDSEPESDWKQPDGADNDGDTFTDEGNQVLSYWETPISITGMAFVPTANSGDVCKDNENKELQLNTLNDINGVENFLTMKSIYPVNGKLKDQTMTCAADNMYDKPQSSSETGFGFRVSKAYYNQLNSYPGQHEGFANMAGYTDVALFNDMETLLHLDNPTPVGLSLPDDSFDIHVFRDESDADTDHNGVPDSYGANVDSYRDMLANSEDSSESGDPRPRAKYSWPSSGLLEFNYALTYNRSDGTAMPQFLGVQKVYNLVSDSNPVITIASVPDYLNPERTKFSFGISADFAAIANFQVNLTDLGDIDDFLHTYLGVDPSFSLEDIFSNVLDAEELVKEVTGGDLTQILTPVVDAALDSGPVNSVINNFADAIGSVNRIPEEISSRTADVLDQFREQLIAEITSGAEPLNGASGQLQRLFDELAPYLAAPPDVVNSYPGNPYSAAQQEELEAALQKLRDALQSVEGVLDDLHSGIGTAQNEVNSLANELDSALAQVTTLLNTIKTTILDPAGALGEFTGLSGNPIIEKVNEVKETVQDVLNTIQAIPIDTIGSALQAAASAVGADIDTSLLTDVMNTVNSVANSLEEIIQQAENLLQTTMSAMPAVFDDAEDLLDQIIVSLNSVNTMLDTAQSVINGYLDDVDNQILALKGNITSVRELLTADQLVPDSSIYPDYNSLAQLGQQKLNELAMLMVSNLLDQFPTGALYDVVNNIKTQILANPDRAFQYVFVDGIESLLSSPLQEAQDAIVNELSAILDQALSVIPSPDAEDIKGIIRNAILNSQPVIDLNNSFYDLISPVADAVDEVATQMTASINQLIQQAIEAISAGINEAIESVTSAIADFDLVGARLDGYAIANQEELEQIHIEAEFEFGGDPDPTVYFAALDITSWNSENGKGACVADAAGLIDAVISTRDISADMLGLPIGIKEAALGFTLDGGVPIGVFGRIYTSGEINFEAAAIKDIGLEFGMGQIENYVGGKAAGRIESYTINMLAFYFGKSCDFGVLERLDPEVASFIGEVVPLEGIYVRGAVSIPIINFGCVLTIGCGVDLGMWYLSGIFGGLFGGSVYGEAICLVSIRGEMTLMGLKSGDDYKFQGNGWIAGGLGFCEPEDWDTIADVRDDDWCLTGDASFGATYSSVDEEFSLSGPDFNCCD